jgi:isopentenyl phosphate kinase
MMEEVHGTPKLQFLKLGGSLITDKEKPRTARQEVIDRLVSEIRQALESKPGQQLLLGHGSGSFGHVVARQYGTRLGVRSPADWRGFAAVWQEARSLNQIVMDALYQAGLSAIAFPVSSSAVTDDGQIVRWDIEPLRAALRAGLLPVVYGDVVFDRKLGGTILSTEDIFSYLAGKLKPFRILLAGMEPGVWSDYPGKTQLISQITPQTYADTLAVYGATAGDDVTGGMGGKVQDMLDLVRALPGLEAVIFSGVQAGNLEAAVRGEVLGTRLTAPGG